MSTGKKEIKWSNSIRVAVLPPTSMDNSIGHLHLLGPLFFRFARVVEAVVRAGARAKLAGAGQSVAGLLQVLAGSRLMVTG